MRLSFWRPKRGSVVAAPGTTGLPTPPPPSPSIVIDEPVATPPQAPRPSMGLASLKRLLADDLSDGDKLRVLQGAVEHLEAGALLTVRELDGLVGLATWLFSHPWGTRLFADQDRLVPQLYWRLEFALRTASPKHGMKLEDYVGEESVIGSRLRQLRELKH